MKRKFYLLFTALLMMATTSAWADITYVQGQRVKGISDLSAGDLVVIEAASSKTVYGFYIKGSDNTFTDSKGFDQNSVWKVVATETDNTYKFQNNANGKYIAGSIDSPTLVDSESDALELTLSGKSSSWFSYTSQSTYPQGWDDNSIVISNESTLYANDAGKVSNNTIPFTSGAWHNCQWNFYKAVDDSYTHSITWNVLENGKIVATETRTGCVNGVAYDCSIGNQYPGVLLNQNTIIGTNEDQTINTEYTIDYSKIPFRYSASIDNAYWYQMAIRESSLYLKFNGSNSNIQSTYTAPSSNDDDEYLFAFVGTPFGFKLYNKAASNKPFGPTTCYNGVNFITGDESSAATLVYQISNNKNYIHYQNDELGYLNNFGGSGSRTISIWKSANDGGSVIYFKKLPSTITWNVVDEENNTIATETVSGYIGDECSPSNLASSYGVTLTPSSVVPISSTDTVNSTYTYSGSIQYSKNYDNARWFRMRVRAQYRNCYYDGTKVRAYDTAPTDANMNSYLFAFVGDPFNGFKLYNAEAGNQPFKPETSIGKADFAPTSDIGEAATFKFESISGSVGVLITELLNGNTYYLNNLGGNDQIGIWNASSAKTDGGSVFYITGTVEVNDAVINNLHYTLYSDGTAYLNENNKNYNSAGVVVVPDTVNYEYNGTKKTYKVAGLIGQTFHGNTAIKTLRFESATLDYSKGTQMFEKMSKLTSLTLPPPTENTTTELDTWVMNACTSLVSIEIPEGFTKLNDVDTKDLTSLTTMILPSTLKSIGETCFNGTTFSNANKNYYVIINAENAPTISSNNNDNIKNAIVIVPSNAAKINYENADIWKLAKAIITRDEKAILDGTSEDKNGLVYVLSSSTLDHQNVVKKGDTYTCANLVLTDGYSFAPTKEFTATNATYSRKMGTWGTLVLPFTVKSDKNVQIYTVTRIDDSDNLIVESAESLSAGTPGIIKRLSIDSVVTFTATNAENVSDSITNSLLVGSYTQDNLIQNTANAYYIYGDKFYKNGGSFYADAFRAYLVNSGTPSPSFNILVDDDPTGINGAATDDAADEIEGVYSVSGVKLSDLQKGINIVRYRSGKTQKVILK